MKYLALSLILALVLGSARSQGDQPAKETYNKALQHFNNSKFNESNRLIRDTEALLGKAMPVTVAMKVRNYFGLKDYAAARKALSDFLKLDAHPNLTHEMLVYAGKLDKLAMQAPISKLDGQLKIATDNYEEVQYKLQGLKVQPLIRQKLNAFKTLQPGKVYIFQKKKPASVYERSYFVFYDDRYIIYTLPNPSTRLLSQMKKDVLVFGSDHANSSRLFNDDAVVTRPLVPTGAGEAQRAFQKSLYYSNVFLGGNGDELLWSGRQNVTYEEDVYYFFFKNVLYADIEMKAKSSAGFSQPLIETGEIKKELDFRLISDNSLLASITEEGFADVRTSGEPLKATLRIHTYNPTLSRYMLFVHKKITYHTEGTVPVGYAIGDDVYSGNVLYYKPIAIKALYGMRAFSSNYGTSDDLLNSVLDTENNIEISKLAFDNVYDAFSQEFAVLENRYFTSPGYTRPMDLAIEMSRAIPARQKSDEAEESGTPDFLPPEKSAEFPGGEAGLRAYLKENTRFPTELYTGPTGRVLIQFTVSETGQVEDAKVFKSLHPSIDQEALRVINLMPVWTPAEQGEKRVKARQIIPFSFN